MKQPDHTIIYFSGVTYKAVGEAYLTAHPKRLAHCGILLSFFDLQDKRGPTWRRLGKKDVPKARKKAKFRGRVEGGAVKKWFITYWKRNARSTKKRLVAAAVEALGPSVATTAANYIAGALRRADVLGFRLVEKRTKGKRTLMRQTDERTRRGFLYEEKIS